MKKKIQELLSFQFSWLAIWHIIMIKISGKISDIKNMKGSLNMLTYGSSSVCCSWSCYLGYLYPVSSFPGCISRKLDWEWRSQDWNPRAHTGCRKTVQANLFKFILSKDKGVSLVNPLLVMSLWRVGQEPLPCSHEYSIMSIVS